MIILASSSPVRKALLSNAGLDFEVVAAEIDERAVEDRLHREGHGGVEIARRLAGEKAREVSRRRPGAVVIGADQTLTLNGKRLHKPVDRADARARLVALRGRDHRLEAGVALARDGALLWSAADGATLTMRAVSDAELDAVLAAEGDAILASVGAYRLEGPSIRLFEAVRGDYFTVLGLPLLPLLAALRTHVPEAFQDP